MSEKCLFSYKLCKISSLCYYYLRSEQKIFPKEIKSLAQRIHNILQALSEDERDKYQQLLGSMGHVLYLDRRHIPLAIRADRSRNVYWHGMHKEIAKDVDKEYGKLFNDAAGKSP